MIAIKYVRRLNKRFIVCRRILPYSAERYGLQPATSQLPTFLPPVAAFIFFRLVQAHPVLLHSFRVLHSSRNHIGQCFRILTDFNAYYPCPLVELEVFSIFGSTRPIRFRRQQAAGEICCCQHDGVRDLFHKQQYQQPVHCDAHPLV